MAIQATDSDKVVSWLPLYHDMGLIAGFYLPLTAGIPLVQIDPFEWVIAPAIFLQAAGVERATMAWLPNFAYSLMADRVHDEDIEGVSLGSLRLLVNCSEPIRADSHDRFAARFASHGFERSALSCSFAMAETTFAVTQTTPGVEATRLLVDRHQLAASGTAKISEDPSQRWCVSSGTPIDGCEVRVCDDRGVDLPDGRVGELLIRSVSMFEGYKNYDEKTAEVLRDGWYYSGDYGFRLDGEYYVVGRKKDVIIVAGKNLYPEDIEDTIGQVDGVIAGRVVAFGVEDAASGTEVVCVIAETAVTKTADRQQLRNAIIKAGMSIDVTVARVFLAPPRWLFKSSSGKPSRKENRERALALLSVLDKEE